MEKGKTKRKHTKFFVAAWIVTALFAMAIVITLIIFWNFLAAFEKSDPRYYIDEVVTAIEERRYDDAAALAHFEESKFFSKEQYESYIKTTLGEETGLKVREVKSEKEGEKIYRVKGVNGELRFIVTEQPDTLGFGLSSYTVKQELGESGSWKIAAPDSVTVSVNGVELDESYRTDEAVWPTQFDTLHDTSFAPRLAVYKVDGLYVKPEVSVPGAQVQVDYSDKNCTAQVSVIKADIPQDRSAAILKAAKTYAYFVSGDATLANVAQLLYTDTAFYDSVKTYSSYWYISHDSAEFENLKVLNYAEYSHDAFSAEVTFDYHVRRARGNIDKTYPTHYRVSFAKIDGKMKVVNIEVL